MRPTADGVKHGIRWAFALALLAMLAAGFGVGVYWLFFDNTPVFELHARPRLDPLPSGCVEPGDELFILYDVTINDEPEGIRARRIVCEESDSVETIVWEDEAQTGLRLGSHVFRLPIRVPRQVPPNAQCRYEVILKHWINPLVGERRTVVPPVPFCTAGGSP